MIPSLISNLFAWLGKGLVRLCYKEEGMDACEMLGKDLKGISGLWGIGLLIWAICAPMAVLGPIEGEFFLGQTLYAVAYLVAYVVWFVLTRKQVPELVAASKEYIGSASGGFRKLTKEQTQQDALSDAKPVRTATGWRCSCGKEHPAYVSSCDCGVNKRDIQ